MARKTETKVIGGLEYKATALGAREGAEGLRRIAAKIAAALGTLRSKDSDVLPVIAGVAASLSSEDLVWFCSAFGRVTSVEVVPGSNKRPLVDAVFDEIFSGDYESMLAFLQMNLELNYGGFFAGALEKLGQSAPKPPATE